MHPMRPGAPFPIRHHTLRATCIILLIHSDRRTALDLEAGMYSGFETADIVHPATRFQK